MSRTRIALAILLVLVVALFAATARWIVWPDTDPAPEACRRRRRARRRRERSGSTTGLRLVRKDVAPVLLISDGERQGWKEANALCKGGAAFQVVCFKPVPGRTQGEAREVARIAGERGWKKVVVVTSDYHAVRAGWLFGRCFGHDVPVVGAGPGGLPSPDQIVHEWLGYAHGFLIERDC